MICAVVLAAGQSRRMGSQKLLLPYHGATIIAHVVEQVLAGAVAEVYVVVGRDAEAIKAELAPRRVHFVANPCHDSEMLASVRCGLRALPVGCEAVLVVPGDQAGLTTALLDRLIEAYRSSGKPLVVPRYAGRRGHPLLVAATFRDEILTCFDDTGLRGLLLDHAAQVHDLDVPFPGALSDVDTPEDYQQAL